LQPRYIVAILCGLLMFGAGAFCSASYRSRNIPAHDTNRIEGQEPEATDSLLAEEEEALIKAYLVMTMAESPDIILTAYHDPELKDAVVSFFGELTGSLNVANAVLSNSAAFDIPPALAFALCWEESRYNPIAINRNRNETIDRGLFQLNNRTFPDLTVSDFFDLDSNAQRGLSHLRWCLNNAGTEVAGLAMYNAGTTRVRSAGTPKNTLDYISRILKEQRRIEGLFLTEYPRIVYTEPVEEEIIKPAAFRLSLLTPLGGR